MGKIPFDLAEAEQELQEGPLTEYSGPSFALLKVGLSLKSMVVASIFVSVLFPIRCSTRVHSKCGHFRYRFFLCEITRGIYRRMCV